jgi:hypothetical protein
MCSPDAAFMNSASVLLIDMPFSTLGICVALPAVEIVSLSCSLVGSTYKLHLKGFLDGGHDECERSPVSC